MKTKHSKEALQELAPKCQHGHACVETGRCGDRELCKVKRCAGESVLFLEGDVPFVCPYLLSFGYGHLCTCPVHAQLYKSDQNCFSSETPDPLRNKLASTNKY
ncbi:hypothetical protein OR1_00233 [Geobacter sp. OR-1]|uniref:hypothetical protein n=1 Tax=Geobacter sp. OR-1 TaxID=1266765 RepID=UPI000541C461|nr:hypothetical protein [Geobacter sp. OR-1]GAM07964.1 hypothetical protein OR1_00233 [Geobacter sp. OR-1]